MKITAYCGTMAEYQTDRLFCMVILNHAVRLYDYHLRKKNYKTQYTINF